MMPRTRALLLATVAGSLLLPHAARSAETGSFEKPLKVKQARVGQRDERPVCDREAKVAPLTSEGVYRCQGLPFEVALEPGVPYEQLWGRGWLSLQRGSKEGMVVVSFQPAPWTLQPDRKEGQGSYAGQFLKAIGANPLTLGEMTPYEQAGSEEARSQSFDFGPPERRFAGESRSFFVRGWFVNMMIGGLPGSPLARGGPGARALFRSMRVVEKPRVLTHRFSSGASMNLPAETWLAGSEKRPGIAASVRYTVPSSGMMLSLSEGTAPKACEDLSEADWTTLTGDVAPRDEKGAVHFQSSRWLRFGKERFFSARARTEVSGGKLVPAVALLGCRSGRLFQIFALDSLSRLPAMEEEVIGLLGTLRLD